MWRYLVLIGALVSCSDPQAPVEPVFPSNLETSELMTFCLQVEGRSLDNFCAGYVIATFDQLTLGRKICPSASVTSDQILAVATKHL
jgi:hypothetical protein